MPLALLLLNVASLSTSLGALAALAALALHLRSRAVLLLLAAVLLLTIDYLLGVVSFALPAGAVGMEPPVLGTAAGRMVVLFGLKGICHIGMLLTAPLAILLMSGRRPSPAAAWAVGGSSAVLLAVIVLMMSGVLGAGPVAVYAVTAIPAYAAYVTCLVLLLRLRPRLEADRTVRAVVTAGIAALALFVPVMFAADIAGLTGAVRRVLPVDPVAYLVLTAGVLSCSLLILLGGRRRLEPGDVEAFCRRHDLSIREREVLLLLVRGLPYKQIAQALGISLDTAKTHVSHIYRKTSSTGKTDLFYRIRLGGS